MQFAAQLDTLLSQVSQLQIQVYTTMVPDLTQARHKQLAVVLAQLDRARHAVSQALELEKLRTN